MNRNALQSGRLRFYPCLPSVIQFFLFGLDGLGTCAVLLLQCGLVCFGI